MRRPLAAAAALLLLAACEPEYAETMGHAETAAPAEAGEGEHHPEVTGPADPHAVSGSRVDTTQTIHHPAADGNAGRPSDDEGGAPAAAEHSGEGH